MELVFVESKLKHYIQKTLTCCCVKYPWWCTQMHSALLPVTQLLHPPAVLSCTCRGLSRGNLIPPGVPLKTRPLCTGVLCPHDESVWWIRSSSSNPTSSLSCCCIQRHCLSALAVFEGCCMCVYLSISESVCALYLEVKLCITRDKSEERRRKSFHWC